MTPAHAFFLFFQLPAPAICFFLRAAVAIAIFVSVNCSPSMRQSKDNFELIHLSGRKKTERERMLSLCGAERLESLFFADADRRRLATPFDALEGEEEEKKHRHSLPLADDPQVVQVPGAQVSRQRRHHARWKRPGRMKKREMKRARVWNAMGVGERKIGGREKRERK